MKHSYSIINSLFITWLVWGPVIINSQPGTTFFMFGIDWKADNLDNTMFWWGIIMVLLISINTELKEREEKKRYKYESQGR